MFAWGSSEIRCKHPRGNGGGGADAGGNDCGDGGEENGPTVTVAVPRAIDGIGGNSVSQNTSAKNKYPTLAIGMILFFVFGGQYTLTSCMVGQIPQ